MMSQAEFDAKTVALREEYKADMREIQRNSIFRMATLDAEALELTLRSRIANLDNDPATASEYDRRAKESRMQKDEINRETGSALRNRSEKYMQDRNAMQAELSAWLKARKEAGTVSRRDFNEAVTTIRRFLLQAGHDGIVMPYGSQVVEIRFRQAEAKAEEGGAA